MCIPKWQVCDGVPQCHDKSDELTCAVITNGCNTTQFKCANRKCIANAFVCDSKDDCGDASDEKYCGKCCMTNDFVTVSRFAMSMKSEIVSDKRYYGNRDMIVTCHFQISLLNSIVRTMS